MVIPMNEAKHMMKTLQLVLASTAELIQSDYAVARGNTSEKVKSTPLKYVEDTPHILEHPIQVGTRFEVRNPLMNRAPGRGVTCGTR